MSNVVNINRQNLRNNNFQISFCGKKNKKDRNKLNKKHYLNINTSIDTKKTADIFEKKVPLMPAGIDGVFGASAAYLSGRIDAETYKKAASLHSVSLFQRVQFGIEKEDFAKKYSKEIDLVKKINTLCYSYNRDLKNIDEFDIKLSKVLLDYIGEQ